MPIYKFSAVKSGSTEKINSELSAENTKDAAALIKKQGLNPIDIKLKNPFSQFSFSTGKIKQQNVVLFTRQLSTLINAGLPLMQALINTTEQTQDRALQKIIQACIESIRSGKSLSESLSPYPKVFNVIYLNLVAAGEASGSLDKSLNRLAEQLEKDANITKKIRSAFVYPIIVLVVMLGVMGFMVVKVLPAVGTLYSGLASGSKLPLITRMLLAISHAIISYWWLLILIVVGLVILVNYWRKTKVGTSILDNLKMNMWPIGPLFMKLYMARFSRTASTLVASGLPLIQVLEITSKAVDNTHIEKTILESIKKVKLGKSLSETLENDKNFLSLVPSMLKIGESSGTIDQMLERLAIYYEKEVDDEVAGISTLIEPVLMIVLGIFAFIIVAAVLLPIYSLAGNSSFTSGGGV
ncbi:MAG TPA: type II secretion system F family protein [Candidatus Saccharimonadales bacterium]|jgi:type IV pilus assembly protein PilC|nr:type II secretion system F family protein [Candidatus Saccharimonadales bacterium]